MNEAAMSEALDTIHDEAIKLLGMDLPVEAHRVAELITSLSRYKFDIRSDRQQAPAGRVARRETYERGGVDYEIIVEQEEGAYWGRWNCPLCGQGRASSKRCTSVEAAIDAAAVNIGPHPALCPKKER